MQRMQHWLHLTHAPLMSLGNSSITLGSLWMLIRFHSPEKLWHGQFASRRVTTQFPRGRWCTWMSSSTKIRYLKCHWFWSNFGWPKRLMGKTSEMCFSTYFVKLNNFLKKYHWNIAWELRYWTCWLCLSVTVTEHSRALMCINMHCRAQGCALLYWYDLVFVSHITGTLEEKRSRSVTPSTTFRRVWHMFFVCFFSQFVLGQLRMLHKIKSGLQLLEILRTILQYCHSLPIPSQNMGLKRRDLGNITCLIQFRRVV